VSDPNDLETALDDLGLSDEAKQALRRIKFEMDEAWREVAVENVALRSIATEVLNLRNSGYDGPFMGEAIEPLMQALHQWEKPPEESLMPEVPEAGREIMLEFRRVYAELPERFIEELKEWEQQDERKALGEGPCPGGDDECHTLRCTEHDHEDPSSPSQYPLPQWREKHDFDGGQCWRCGGVAPGYAMREPTAEVPLVLLKRLVEWSEAVDRKGS